MIAEATDQLLHVVWFWLLIVIAHHKGITLRQAFLIASLVIVPREFIDQWHGWPIGIGKWTDVIFCYVGAFLGWLTFDKGDY